MFISYRREDASGFAGRLHESLTAHFGPDRIFRDVDTIEPGADFGTVIGKSLESCGAFVAVIGREWILDTKGRRRLENPDDWVRLEVAAAIQREVVTVIPVLVEGVPMPSLADLPEPLAPLTRYNALELSDSRWDYDVGRLIRRLETAVGPATVSLPARLRRLAVPRGPVGIAVRLVILLAMVLGGVSLGQVLSGPGNGPGAMTGNFNIAVAEFGAVDANGRAVASPAADALAADVHERLRDELSGIAEEGFSVQLRSPGETGKLGGPTPLRRAAAAAELAGRMKADVVVYGTLELSDPSGFRPEFFVSATKLPGAEELFGQYDLGSRVEVRGDISSNPVVQRDLREQVLGRARALAEFILGLSYLAVSQPGPALEHLEAARDAPGWDERDGKEVLLVMLGHAAARTGDLDKAKAAFDQALALEPEYSRAQIGQADLIFQRARGHCGGATDVDGLRRALAAFERASKAKVQPVLSDVPLKAAFGQGRVELCLSQAGIERWWGPAEAKFERVVDAHAKGNRRLRELAADSHANLGLIHLPAVGDAGAEARYRRAESDYARAIELTRDDSRKALFFGMRGFILMRLGAKEQADAAYRQAISLEKDASVRARYERERAQLGG